MPATSCFTEGSCFEICGDRGIWLHCRASLYAIFTPLGGGLIQKAKWGMASQGSQAGGSGLTDLPDKGSCCGMGNAS